MDELCEQLVSEHADADSSYEEIVELLVQNDVPEAFAREYVKNIRDE